MTINSLLGVNGSEYFPVREIRRDFPILSEKINGRDLIWLDNAATTQKPSCVLDRMSYYYLHENSNVHRGAHTLAARATDAYEDARKKAGKFLHASSSEEMIFVRGTTEAINLVARTFGKLNIGEGDEILLSELEHHANIVPWQMLCQETDARIKVIPVDDNGQLQMEAYEKLLSGRTKLVSVAHVSNALGTITPIPEIIKMAHQYGAKVLVDGAQAVSHLKVDVTGWDCDFYAFSGHKVYGPTGIGAVYIKSEILKELPPYQGGGNMISDVTFDKTSYQGPPKRMEAGTGSIADAVGLGAALDYVTKLNSDRIIAYEHDLLNYATEALKIIPDLSLIGTAEEKTSILSFIIKGFSNEEIGKKLNEAGIAVRAGHHCAQPILRRFGLESTVRPSLAFYNTRAEVDEMARILKRIRKNQSNFYLHNPLFVVY
jgi:cysteine desulfurases, SufS subfamily